MNSSMKAWPFASVTGTYHSATNCKENYKTHSLRRASSSRALARQAVGDHGDAAMRKMPIKPFASTDIPSPRRRSSSKNVRARPAVVEQRSMHSKAMVTVAVKVNVHDDGARKADEEEVRCQRHGGDPGKPTGKRPGNCVIEKQHTDKRGERRWQTRRKFVDANRRNAPAIAQ